MKVTIQGNLAERRDTLSPFYTLEQWALSPTHATKTFLHFGGKSWTYRQAYEYALKYGAWMKDRWNVQKGEVVAMDFMNGETFVWVWFGLWSIGAKPAFLNYNLQDKPLLHCVKTSGSRVVFVDEKVRGNFEGEVAAQLSDAGFRTKGGEVKVCVLDQGVKAEIEATEARRLPNEERGGQMLKNMAVLIYTSGTTGLPKPAVVSWAKAGLAAKFVALWTPLTNQDEVFYTVSRDTTMLTLLFLTCHLVYATISLLCGSSWSTSSLASRSHTFSGREVLSRNILVRCTLHKRHIDSVCRRDMPIPALCASISLGSTA